MNQAATQRRVRSIFVSDLHLGSKQVDPRAFLDFLSTHNAEYLYVVGDFVDGWRMKKARHWRPLYNRILRRFFEMWRDGTRLFYTPGNHDAFMRSFIHDFGIVQVADEFIHETADDRHLLVTHGDQFDSIECSAQWLSMLGTLGFDMLLGVNAVVNGVRRLFGRQPCDFCTPIRYRVKHKLVYTERFRRKLVDHVEAKKCDGIVCGHIHLPAISRMESILYCNCGDWVEHRSAIVEHDDGQLELVDFSAGAARTLAIDDFEESRAKLDVAPAPYVDVVEV